MRSSAIFYRSKLKHAAEVAFLAQKSRDTRPEIEKGPSGRAFLGNR
jgi:hypothetical protein